MNIYAYISSSDIQNASFLRLDNIANFYKWPRHSADLKQPTSEQQTFPLQEINKSYLEMERPIGPRSGYHLGHQNICGLKSMMDYKTPEIGNQQLKAEVNG